jgi:methanogenic corrinoid protein MtbC1
VNHELTLERLFGALITGDRQQARSIVGETVAADIPAEELAHLVCWPLIDMLEKLHRADQLSTLGHHYATRLLRMIVDQMQLRYQQKARRGRRVLMFCGPGEQNELAAQLVADLAEADGYDVQFGGGGIANDEILAEVGELKPDVLLLFASAASDAPHIRQLIDTIHEIGTCRNMQIVVGGGVFNRADGLAEEIGADLWARSPQELLQRLVSQGERRAQPEQRTVGRNRRNRANTAAA